jgi:LmbE family N-acetylglucosaminyl deacetylase
MYYVTRKEISDKMTDYFIYFPPGYNENEVDEIVDISKYWDQKIKAIRAHASQKKDADRLLKIIQKLPKKELFFVIKK